MQPYEIYNHCTFSSPDSVQVFEVHDDYAVVVIDFQYTMLLGRSLTTPRYRFGFFCNASCTSLTAFCEQPYED